jgi:esterase/lipase superfamily enzyme
MGYAVTRIGEENLNLIELIEQSTTSERAENFGWSLLEAPILASVPKPTPETTPELPGDMKDAIDALNDYIDENPIRELTIYVHGANNTFYRSVAQGSQFQYFTGDNAMVLTFAWPSRGNIFGYRKDKRRSDASGQDLAYLIELLAHHSVASRINLIAYSAGGRVAGRALTLLGERYHTQQDLRLGQVYLTQSDQPLEEFVRTLPGYMPLLEGLTVTAAVGDPVLGLSRMTDRQQRLGATGEGDGAKLDIDDELRQTVIDILNSDQMVFIDLRDIPVSEYRFTHGAWYQNSWVSTDVMATLLGGLTAEDRALEPVMVNDVETWIFPPDYIERLKANLLERRGTAEAPPNP